MDQLQKNLYNLLVEIDDICNRNGIIYYLAGGTALGAIRGGGFLPWDDDIDLYITRENWDKLVKIMETETPNDRVFVCTENTDLYCNPVGRYVDRNTTVMMKSQLLVGKACGQLIEFFVMDPMPMNEDDKWRHREYVKAYTELLSPYFVVNRNIISENPDFNYNIYNKYYLKSRMVGRKKVLNELLRKITSVSESSSDYYCMRWGTRTLMYGKDLLGVPRMEKFEGRMFPIPAKQEAVARIAYGDSWMYVPEGAGKVVHNLDKDINTPFSQYVDLYMPLLNRKKLLKSYKKNKRIRAKALYNKTLFRREFLMAKALLAAKTIEKSEPNLDYLESLMKSKKFNVLEEELQYYYEQQLDSNMRSEEILLPVSDMYLYIAIMCQVLQGRYYIVSPLMDFRKQTGKPLNKMLNEADKAITFCHDISVAIYDEKNLCSVNVLLESNSKYAVILPDFARAKLWQLSKKGNTTEDYEELVNEARKQQILFKEDGELIRFEALGLYALGRLKESEERYNMAVQMTRNGFVWKEAMELFDIDAYDIVDGVDQEEDDDDWTESTENED